MLALLRSTERDPLWRREMRERWRRPITVLFLMVYVTGLCWCAYSLYSSLVPVGTVDLGTQTRGIGHQLFMSLLRIQILLWVPVALMLAAPTIAAERERHALTEYLLAGLQSSQIVRAKFASVATFILVMGAIPLPILALCFPLGGVEPLELVVGFLLEIAVATVCAAIGLFVSVNNRRVNSAMQGAIVFSLICLLLTGVALPHLLEISFWVWLLLAAFLALATRAIITSCEVELNVISHYLEQDEPNAPDPQPRFDPEYTRIIPRFRDFQLTPERTRRDYIAQGAAWGKDTSWDLWSERVSAYSAVAQREVRVGLRASRLRMALFPDQPTYQFPPRTWIFFGICGAMIVAAMQQVVLWHLGLALVTIGATIAATSGSSAVFTREREQKMLTQLQLCPLSPLEIVAGKIGGMLLLVARSWGGPLLGWFVVGLSQGPVVALETAVFVVISLLFTIVVATLLSLLCHHTTIATSGTLGTLVVLFVLAPATPISLTYFMPSLQTLLTSFPVGTFWIEPMNIILGNNLMGTSLSLIDALFRATCSLLVLNGLLIMAATFIWARTSPDDGEPRTQFWEHDLTRSWH